MNPLIRLIPPVLVRVFARPYVAGDSIAKALDVAASLWGERQCTSSLDLLAEDIEDRAMAERNLQTYLELLQAVASDQRFADDASRPTVSMKLSSYTTEPLDRGGSGAGAAAAVERIAARAGELGLRATLDMESRHWTDHTLELLDRLHAAGHRHVGCVLQTRLNRTERDLDRLPPGIRVRLVIGIYAEPESVAITDKRAMKERMLSCSRKLLERGHFVEFATHDEEFVRRFVDEVAPSAGAGPDRFEIQMLYGVPRQKLLTELRGRGIATRLYVPFAIGWSMAIAYLRRRLDEYPAMMFLVAKNMLRLG
ncbi:MAG: proline dehydrogenase family protein [Planctomycetes bacterium]|nr:proline dehydrogenase family protein [Planctomycetota bacterium]